MTDPPATGPPPVTAPQPAAGSAPADPPRPPAPGVVSETTAPGGEDPEGS